MIKTRLRAAGGLFVFSLSVLFLLSGQGVLADTGPTQIAPPVPAGLDFGLLSSDREFGSAMGTYAVPSPDSKLVVTSLTVAKDYWTTTSLTLSRLDGSGTTELAPGLGHWDSVFDVTFSADSRRIAYLKMPHWKDASGAIQSRTELHLTTLDGPHDILVAKDVQDFVFSHDDSSLFYTVRGDGHYTVHRFVIKSEATTPIATLDAGYVGELAISPKDSHLLFVFMTKSSPLFDLGSLDLNTAKVTQLNPSSEGHAWPDFWLSPAGDRIAFLCDSPAGFDRHLYLSRLDGTDRVELNQELSPDTATKRHTLEFGSFNPEGTRVHYHAVTRKDDHTSPIQYIRSSYTVATDGSDRQPAPNGDFLPDWSKVVVKGTHHQQLTLVNPDDTSKQELLAKYHEVGSFHVSGDSKYLLFSQSKGFDSSSGFDLYLTDTRTGKVMPLVVDQPGKTGVQFSYFTPDNRHVVFASDSSGALRLYSIEIPAR